MLAPGANTALSGSKAAWTLESDQLTAFGSTAAIALLPVDEKRSPKGTPALFHAPQTDWMEWSGEPEQIACSIDFTRLPTGSDRVLVVVYIYSNLGPISALRALRLTIDGTIKYHLDISGQGETAMIIGEFYLRAGQWKFRALAEGSAYGLSALGRRIGLDIDDANPESRRSDPESGRNGSASSATGTGFAVSPSMVVTCAHVIEGMSEVRINSFNGHHRVEPVMVDTRNDIALLRVEHGTLSPVRFSGASGCSLGDPVVAVGYPMSGVAGGGAHVTQGGVSALFGLRNDSSLLQFTAPIQPGSSGSPLFDAAGGVMGMVTSSVPDAQNMNFAVKLNLLVSFLDACNVSVVLDPLKASISASEIARRVQPSLWKIEARN
ncbi:MULTISPECIES: trypsin-like peptidase domain-containing protein [unclassified Pseudomonas]|uniref:trypsin-like peptidase domain-containing protein n=1 Tax=unclassified Pseudomonas TaxID=196821 RepID=UPI0030D75AD6